MTPQEASEELKEEFEAFKSGIDPADWENPNEELKKIIEANTMAIKALEQQPCEDCISRQYLIERATSWDKHFADSERCVSLTEIQNAPSVTPQTRWIPVSEKPQEGRYLCTYEHWYGKCIDFGSFDGDVWYVKPIAYMPLPQLYKAESENKG